MSRRLVEAVDRLLPQTQCARCGYSACRPYAEAIAGGRAPINRCPPGGPRAIARLAALLGREPVPLDPAVGEQGSWSVAVVDEQACIGCKLCSQVCPVDAIVGTGKRMHTVLSRECTGCELCVPACPVDCVQLQPMPWPCPDGVDEIPQQRPGARGRAEFLEAWMASRAPRARARYHARLRRLLSAERRRAPVPEAESRQRVIAAAVARVRSRRRARERGVEVTDGARGPQSS